MLQLGIRGLGIARFKFNPISWFLKGEPGAWYDPSDLTTLFQDSAGTTPMSAVGTVADQPVGLMLDKSKGLALGAELVTNGDFSNGTTGWTAVGAATWSIVNEKIQGVVTGSPSISGGRYQDVSVVAGQSYKISIDVEIVSITAGRADVICFDGAAFTPVLLNITKTTVGAYQITGMARPSGSVLRFYFVVAGDSLTTTTATFDNISVKQIAGNHAFQGDSTSTPAKRPMLSARVNLLTKTEDFSDGVWINAVLNGTLSSGNISPTGSTNATLYQENTTASVQRGLYETTTVVSGISYTATIYAKDYALGSKRYLTLFPQNITQSYAVYDLSNATVTFTGGANYLSSSISSIGNGWCKCSITFTTASTTLNSVLYLSNSPATQSPIYIGDGVSGIYIWGADLRPTNSGSLLPPYQRVNTASDYDTIGFPLYLKANGLSSAMSTNSIDFSGTDKMTVVTGVRKLSDAVSGILMELSVTTNTNNGSFYIAAPNANTIANFSFAATGTGTLISVPSASTYASPISKVITTQDAIQTPLATLRLDGVQTAFTVLNQGGGNFGNYPLYLFSRAGTSIWFNGQFYGAIIRGAQSDTASVTQTENYMATKTGITF